MVTTHQANTANKKAKSILMVWDRMGDYHRARTNYLAQHSNYTINTADFGSADNLYKWHTQIGSNHFILSNKKVNDFDFFKRTSNYLKLLRAQKVDAVFLPGWSKISYLWFAVLAKTYGKSTYSFVESWYGDNVFVNTIKATIIKFCFNGFFVSGTKAYKHLTWQLQVNRCRVASNYSVVDNAHFGKEKQVSNQLITLLCIARFSSEKNLSFLIQCYKKSALYNKSKLQLVGDGPLKKQLQLLANDKDIQLVDWLTYDELPAAYNNANVFVLASTFEPWGLVVNEAMAAGLPVLVSDQCGCAADLVQQGVNGYIFTCSDEQSLISSLNKIFANQHRLAKMGQAAKAYINQHYSLAQWKKSVEYLVEYV